MRIRGAATSSSRPRPLLVYLTSLLSIVHPGPGQRRRGGGVNDDCVAPSVSVLFAHARGDASTNAPRRKATTTPPPTTTRGTGGSVSGYFFFDSNFDGSRDVNTSAGVSDVFVGLFACAGEIAKTTKTDGAGHYGFDGLPAGRYYVGATPPRYYVFSDVWNGKADESGELLHPDVDSSAGRTECFKLEEGETKAVSFGLRLDFVPSSTLGPTIPVPGDAPLANIASPTMTPTSTSKLVKSPESPSTPPSSISDTSSSSPTPASGDDPLVTMAATASPLTATSPESPSTPLSSIVDTSSSPSSSPSREPSLDVASSSAPRPVATMPSAAPSSSRSVEYFGLATTQRLVMNITGIERLEEEGAWSLATADYVMTYFDTTNDYPGAYDVTVSIRVTNQSSGDGDSTRRRLEANEGSKSVEVAYEQTSIYRTRGAVRGECPTCADEIVARNISERADIFVATAPFAARGGPEQYVNALKSLSPYYEDVTSVVLAHGDPPPPPQMQPIDEDDDFLAVPGTDYNANVMNASNDGKVDWSALMLFLAILTLPMVLFSALNSRYKDRGEEEWSEAADHYDRGAFPRGGGWIEGCDLEAVPPKQKRRSTTGWMHGDPDDGCPRRSTRNVWRTTTMTPHGDFEAGTPEGKQHHAAVVAGDETRTGRIDERRAIEAAAEAVTRSDRNRAGSGDDGSRPPPPSPGIGSSSRRRRSTTRRSLCRRIDVDSVADVPDVTSLDLEIVKRHVHVPCGKLGIVTETPAAGGPAYVCEVRDSSPVVGTILPDDEIIAVDDEDVREMSAIDLRELVTRKSARGAWKITVLREEASTTRGGGRRRRPGEEAASGATGDVGEGGGANAEDSGPPLDNGDDEGEGGHRSRGSLGGVVKTSAASRPCGREIDGSSPGGSRTRSEDGAIGAVEDERERKSSREGEEAERKDADGYPNDDANEAGDIAESSSCSASPVDVFSYPTRERSSSKSARGSATSPAGKLGSISGGGVRGDDAASDQEEMGKRRRPRLH